MPSSRHQTGRGFLYPAGFLLVTGDEIQYNNIIQTIVTGEGEQDGRRAGQAGPAVSAGQEYEQYAAGRRDPAGAARAYEDRPHGRRGRRGAVSDPVGLRAELLLRAARTERLLAQACTEGVAALFLRRRAGCASFEAARRGRGPVYAHGTGSGPDRG